MTHELPGKASHRDIQISYFSDLMNDWNHTIFADIPMKKVHHVMHKSFKTPTGVALKGHLSRFFSSSVRTQPFEALALNATLWCCLGHLEVYVDLQSGVKLSGWRSEALVNFDVHEMERSARFASAYQGLSASFSSGGLVCRLAGHLWSLWVVSSYSCTFRTCH